MRANWARIQQERQSLAADCADKPFKKLSEEFETIMELCKCLQSPESLSSKKMKRTIKSLMERVQNTSELFDAYQELFYSLGKDPTRKNYIKAAMEDLTQKAQKVSSPSPRKRSIAEIIPGISANEDNVSRGSTKIKQGKQSITLHAVEVSSDSEVEEVQQNASRKQS
ncbi:unnamed protein product [Clavelina lepadiformis]|uniref:Uncharacterized protein n=1 Tax=Clavelina lepadiformis TaxID=159417 RepID=A0ABP0GDX9_CLALP